LWLVDLHVVAGTRKQEQLRGREQLVEPPGHALVQVRVGMAEDDPYRTRERPPRSPAGGQREDYKRWERHRPMELWQIDVMGGVRLVDGTQLSVVTDIDDHSRFCAIAKLSPGSRRARCATPNVTPQCGCSLEQRDDSWVGRNP